jgi:hypothetical protein
VKFTRRAAPAFAVESARRPCFRGGIRPPRLLFYSGGEIAAPTSVSAVKTTRRATSAFAVKSARQARFLLSL